MQGAGKDLGGVELVEGLTEQAVSASEPEGLFFPCVDTHLPRHSPQAAV